MLFLAAEVVLELAHPGRVVPHELFGTNLPVRAQATPDVLERLRGFGLALFRYPGGGAPGWHVEPPRFDWSIGPDDDSCGATGTTCPTTQPLERVFYPNGRTIALAARELVTGKRNGWEPPAEEAKEIREFKGPF